MRVHEYNNWESLTYYLGEPLMDGQAGHHPTLSSNRLTPENCQRARIQFPTGAIETHEIEWRRETHHYNDHGHPGAATSDVPYIQVEYNGITLEVKLSHKDLDVWQFFA